MSDGHAASAEQPQSSQAKGTRSDGLTIKAIAAAVLTVLALIPLYLVGDLIDERWSRERQVVQEIGAVWGEPQRLAGPYLEIPYTRTKQHGSGAGNPVRDRLLILPASLDMAISLAPEIRRRGIFDAVVYAADVRLDGAFPPITDDMFPADMIAIDWDNAMLRLDTTDARTIRGEIETVWRAAPLDLTPLSTSPVMPGTQTPLGAPAGWDNDASAGDEGVFAITYTVAGSHDLGILPTATSTHATIRSPWSAPSFQGSFLPVASEIGSDGFAATWDISGYARGYPSFWSASQLNHVIVDINETAFGVRLVEEVGIYRKTERAVKYGLLFFVATFLTFLILEVSFGAKLHVLHYGLVGAALCVFYVLLLSLAEVIGFSAAFGVSALAVVLQTGLFTLSVVRRLGATLVFVAILAGVYAYLYVLLDLEELALLGGSVGLFVLLSVAMYALRGINLSPGRATPGPALARAPSPAPSD
ncbi:MAG: cell envelope integrity protein CreD [Pseudomonadota bacterium]